MENANYKVCDICGNLVDNNDIVDINDKELCKSCIGKKLEQNEKFSPLATFICSIIPGIGHIYLGKKQKGLFLLFSSLLCILLIVFWCTLGYVMIDELFSYTDISEFLMITNTITFGILQISIYLYSFFDANISRKYIESGEYREDFIDRLTNKILNKNKKYLENKIIDKRLQ